MRIDDIAPDLLLEMAYTRQRATQIISGLEMQINLHLLKLAAVPMPDQNSHWRHEVATWLTTIGAIRLKPSTKPAPARFYMRLLYDEPFGQNEASAVTVRLQLIRQQYGELTGNLDIEALAEKLKNFHREFAAECEKGIVTLATINRLLIDFQQPTGFDATLTETTATL